MKKRIKKIFSILILVMILSLLIAFINSKDIVTFVSPSFTTSGVNESVTEDVFYNYNVSANVSANGNPIVVYSIVNISSSTNYGFTDPSQYYWILLNSSTGMLTINSTNDTNTGRLNISIYIRNSEGEGISQLFYYTVNASNDYPNITSINNTYNMTANTSFIRYVNGSDEERHYPFLFNISFFTNCTKRAWNNRTNCDLFNMINSSNSSAMMNYTSNKYDAGVYWANMSVMDFGANYICSSGFCLANYSENRTYMYNRVLQFNVYTYLEVNATNCSNRIFQENQSGVCYINITSRDFADNIAYTSNATLSYYPGFVSNASWFYANTSNFTNNFTYSVLVNVTPQKNAIGNWTINFSARDINFSENAYTLFNVTVNRTNNDIPRIATIPNVNTSTALLIRVNLTVYDDDNLIPDKYTYNETISFVLNVTNRTNTSQSFNFSAMNFTVQILNYSISGTNRTEGKIELTPNKTMAGEFYVNVTAIDLNGANVATVFNMTIRNNIFPEWNSSFNRTAIIYEHNYTYFNLTENVSDGNLEDTINFTYSIDSYFPSFNLNRTTGVINFTANDSDVGFHIVTINATDGYLINTTTMNFSVLNINETPAIVRPIQISGIGSSGDSSTEMHAREDASTIIVMYGEDADSGIPYNQRSYYDEALVIRNLTITGANSSLFNFTSIVQAPNNTNRSTFQAQFTPRMYDRGNYTIFINLSDNSNRSDSINFNLIVDSVSHNPNISIMDNQTTAVNRTLYFRVNATDLEDGNSTTPGNNNFTFRYSFVNGTDFINNNQSIFNTTSGVFNYTFNSSQGGKYRLNISVNDSSGNNDTSLFWIFVYDVPNITSPDISYQYTNMYENSTYLLNFTINHSMADNVSCYIYLQSINGSNVLKRNISVYGNNSMFYWNYTINFTEETYGTGNLTLITYPNNGNLSNAIQLNSTKRWNITINHTNSPLQFLANIGSSNNSIYGGSPQQIVLSDYFNDADASDIYRNQSITFSTITVPITGTITVSTIQWNGTTPMMTFTSSGAAKASYTLIATEWNETNSSMNISSVTSNTFSVELTSSETVVTVTVPASGGGSSTVTNLVPYALKIIAPSKISGYSGEKIIIPLKLVNNGKETFSNINLSAFGFKDGSLNNILKITFDNNTVSSLGPGKNVSLTMTAFFNTTKTGDYEITVYANSKSPVYVDWSKIYINLQKINETELRKFILFTEEFIVQNPTCLELQERLDEANILVEEEDFNNARAIAESVLNKCREYVEQVSLPIKKSNYFNEVLQYLTIAIVLAAFAGIINYFYRRSKFKSNIKPVDNTKKEPDKKTSNDFYYSLQKM